MKRSSFVFGAALAVVLLGAAPPSAPTSAAPSLTVYAAASLREAFEAAGPAFTKATGTTVVFNFGGSDTLATQIAAGAPASVFASANEAQMKRLADARLLAGSPVTFARNRLVLVTPLANPKGVRALADLAKPGIEIVLAAPDVPVGRYARVAFAKMNGRPGYGDDFAGAVEKNVLSNELDVKAVATKVALGEADAGIVYATDLTRSVAPNVTVVQLPAEAQVEATYPIAALAAAPDAATARAFVDFILHDGQRFLKERGFLAP